MKNSENFQTILSNEKECIKKHKEYAMLCDSDLDVIKYHDEVVLYIDSLLDLLIKNDLPRNYLNSLERDFHSLLNLFSYRKQPTNDFINDSNIKEIKSVISNNKEEIFRLLKLAKFQFNFFITIDFLKTNIVAIGSNGSGKSTLSIQFKNLMQNNGIVISAQKFLLIPKFNNLQNPNITQQKLYETRNWDKNNKHEGSYSHLKDEFSIVLQNLISQNISVSTEYRVKAIEQMKIGNPISEPQETKLDKTFEIWNSLIDHRKISITDGMNISISSSSSSNYPPMQLSDGEKVILFLISQVLQAPNSGFIVVDEPEMYLHKAIVKKLWNILEREREDCIFIYLTHDLEFASSRTTAKKIWIKSYEYPDYWEIESIPENSIPETLLFELIGSRKNIIFCEGKKGGIDDSILNLIYPDYTITCVGSCFNVIHYTKAFNSISSIHIKAVGIIDSDHHPTNRLISLKEELIFSFNVAEMENLLLDDRFLKLLAERLLVEDQNAVEKIKEETFKMLGKDLEVQVSNFISSKINYYFKDSHIKKGNNISEVNSNFSHFINNITIDEWYTSRIQELNGILTSRDYRKLLQIYNNKGLKCIAERILKISNFTERAMKFLFESEDAQNIIKEYFPQI